MDDRIPITVFTSSYNYATYLRDAIRSVLDQSFRDFEYHLIDYGSTDNTWEVIKSYDDPRIVPIQLGEQKNKSVVMNESVRRAKGRWWVWCPADDFLHIKLLERKLEYAVARPDAVIYDDFWEVDAQNRMINEVNLPPRSQEDLRREIMTSGVIGFTGIMIPTDVLKKLPFPEDEDISEDYQWMIEALINRVPFIHVREKLHYKRQHGGMVSQSRRDEVMMNIQTIWGKIKDKYGDT